MTINGGIDHTRRQGFKMSTVHCGKLTISVVTLSSRNYLVNFLRKKSKND